jgi:HTH-type transcriptional regulator / antitoxin HipB
MRSHITPRSRELPANLRDALIEARHTLGWSQSELGQRLGLPQAHISGIETGRVVPRYDTLLDLVRVLDHDLLLVPREVVPVVQSLVRDYRNRHARSNETTEEQPLYAIEEGDSSS